jgi:hypothetical protein
MEEIVKIAIITLTPFLQSEVSVNYLKATNFMFLGGLVLALVSIS